jgi:hypothetical protein
MVFYLKKAVFRTAHNITVGFAAVNIRNFKKTISLSYRYDMPFPCVMFHAGKFVIDHLIFTIGHLLYQRSRIQFDCDIFNVAGKCHHQNILPRVDRGG